MFSLPYNDNTLKAWAPYENWVQMEWLYPGERAHKVFRSFKKIEKAIKEHGFHGWIMASERSHKNMHRHIMRVGGKPYSIDDHNVYFKKELVS